MQYPILNLKITGCEKIQDNMPEKPKNEHRVETDTHHPDIGNNRQIIKITMINPFNKQVKGLENFTREL